MREAFDITLFISGVLSGSKTTRQRHIKQAQFIQITISQYWCKRSPWTWQEKHIRWLLTIHLKSKSPSTRYYYYLTAKIIWRRMNRHLPPNVLTEVRMTEHRTRTQNKNNNH